MKNEGGMSEEAVSDFEISPIPESKGGGFALVRYVGKGGVVAVPEGVRQIEPRAFACAEVTEVILPEGVRTIDAGN